MKCAACGYSNQKDAMFDHRHGVTDPVNGSMEFIEIHGCKKGKDRIFRGKVCRKPPVIIYACPNCGTVKMEVR